MKNQGIIESQKDLGYKMGYSNEATISQVINGKVKEPKDFIERLVRFVPSLNIEWLESGKGEMLKDSIQEANGDNNTQVAGNANHVNSTAAMQLALSEISEMRKLIQEQVRNNQEQFNRFMSVIERLTN